MKLILYPSKFKKNFKIYYYGNSNKSNYSQLYLFHPQVGGEIENGALMNEYSLVEDVFRIPWGHHKVIMDKVKGFFIPFTKQNLTFFAFLLYFLV